MRSDPGIPEPFAGAVYELADSVGFDSEDRRRLRGVQSFDLDQPDRFLPAGMDRAERLRGGGLLEPVDVELFGVLACGVSLEVGAGELTIAACPVGSRVADRAVQVGPEGVGRAVA